MKPQVWIRSGIWDSVWVLSGIPIAFAFYVLSKFGVPDFAFLCTFVFFWGAHLPSPIFMAWRHAGFKALMRENKRKFIFLPILGPLGGAFLGLLTGLNLTGFKAGADFLPHVTSPKDYVNAIILLFWAYTLWNGFHFSAQNFGVLSIYRNKRGGYNPFQRTLDLTFCHFSCLVMVPLGWYLTKHSFINNFFNYVPLVEEPTYRICGIAVAISCFAFTTVMVTREIMRRENFCLPRLVVMLNIGLLPVVIFGSTHAFNAMYGISHFMTAIGLAAHVLSVHKAKTSSERRWNHSFAFFAGLMMVVSIFPVFIIAKTIEVENLSSAFVSLSGVSVAVMTLVGFRFGLAVVHFLYDRYVYKLSDKNVRATIGADLLSGVVSTSTPVKKSTVKKAA